MTPPADQACEIQLENHEGDRAFRYRLTLAAPDAAGRSRIERVALLRTPKVPAERPLGVVRELDLLAPRVGEGGEPVEPPAEWVDWSGWPLRLTFSAPRFDRPRAVGRYTLETRPEATPADLGGCIFSLEGSCTILSQVGGGCVDQWRVRLTPTEARVRLPLPSGTALVVSRGPTAREHEWGLEVPIGTPVVAAAGGTVLWTTEVGGAGACDLPNAERVSSITMQHADGTMAYYVHVLATVSSGEVVAAGQAIGTTAPNECTPQLQFGVYPANGEALPDAPEARALPIVFDGLGALREGESYVVP